VSARRAATSRGEQTKPRIPAARPMRASNNTCSAGERSRPEALSWAWSMLVSTVTASSSGGSAKLSSAAGRRRAWPGSGGVDGYHAHAQGRGRAHRRGGGVGNVVDFQVEEDGVAALDERFQDGGNRRQQRAPAPP